MSQATSGIGLFVWLELATIGGAFVVIFMANIDQTNPTTSEAGLVRLGGRVQGVGILSAVVMFL